MSKRQLTYTEEFKKDAVSLALKSSSITKVCRDLGVPKSTLNGWLKKIVQEKDSDISLNLHEEIKQLRKENARLKEERAILKKAAKFFAKESI